MPLTTEERKELIRTWGDRSARAVAAEFNERHPDRHPVSHVSVAQLFTRFMKTGSVADRPRSGRPVTETDEATSVAVLATFAKSSTPSTRRLSMECGVKRRSVGRILKEHRWHPYKLQMQHHMSEDDPDRRMQFCEWAVAQLQEDPDFHTKILFTDEANFYVHGEVNKQNLRYWSPNNPQWTDPCKLVGRGKLLVWCGLWCSKVIGPFFIPGNLNADMYLNMLSDIILPSVMSADDTFPSFFQQDGAPPHYGLGVCTHRDEQFPG